MDLGFGSVFSLLYIFSFRYFVTYSRLFKWCEIYDVQQLCYKLLFGCFSLGFFLFLFSPFFFFGIRKTLSSNHNYPLWIFINFYFFDEFNDDVNRCINLKKLRILYNFCVLMNLENFIGGCGMRLLKRFANWEKNQGEYNNI